VGFLYTVCPKEPFDILDMSMLRKGRWLFNSVFMVYYMLGWMLLRWLRKSFSSSGA